MNGTHPSSPFKANWKLNDGERVTAVVKDQFKGWIVFTDEIVMGPTNAP